MICKSMRPSSLSVFSVFQAALLFVHSNCSVPDEMVNSILEYVPEDMNLSAGSNHFSLRRRAAWLPLNEQESRLYIQNYDGFRARAERALGNIREQITLSLSADITRTYFADLNVRANINALLANPRKQLRVNLGNDFREYMLNPHFRANVDNLVENPLIQVWSDVEELDLHHTRVTDISPLARLNNLKELDLARTQIADITPLAGLKNLKRLRLPDTQVTDISPLAELENLKELHLYETPVADISSLSHLRGLTIHRW